MSLDKSLKSKSSLERHRNVLKRSERIEVLQRDDRWDPGQSPFGLPKVAHRKAKVGKRGKAAHAEGEAAAGTKEGGAAKPSS